MGLEHLDVEQAYAVGETCIMYANGDRAMRRARRAGRIPRRCRICETPWKGQCFTRVRRKHRGIAAAAYDTARRERRVGREIFAGQTRRD